jgi:hypothetical protein
LIPSLPHGAVTTILRGYKGESPIIGVVDGLMAMFIFFKISEFFVKVSLSISYKASPVNGAMYVVWIVHWSDSFVTIGSDWVAEAEGFAWFSGFSRFSEKF